MDNIHTMSWACVAALLSGRNDELFASVGEHLDISCAARQKHHGVACLLANHIIARHESSIPCMLLAASVQMRL